MQKGVYPRTANQLAASVANLAKGREPAARDKAKTSLRLLGQDLDWRLKVSNSTRRAMHDPEIRQRHLAGLKGLAVNIKGGNGQPLTPFISCLWSHLQPLGWKLEHVIKTRGHGTEHNPPFNYKADFAHPTAKVVLEADGPSHNNLRQQLKDRKKTRVLQALGWKVIRVPHR